MHEALTPPDAGPAGPRTSSTGARLAAVLGAPVLGVLTGVAWTLLAPVPQFVVADGGLVQPPVEAETAVAADGWFAVCAAVAGAVAAVAVFLRVRAARLAVLAWLTVGGLVASVVAWRVGVVLTPDGLPSDPAGLTVGERVDGPLRLSALGVLLAWPLSSVVVYFALAAGLDRPPARPAAPVIPDDRWGPAPPQ